MIASKKDTDEIKANLAANREETSKKIEKVNERVDSVAISCAQNTETIELLQASIESLKQDQLRNNICISGVPSNMIENTSTSDIVINIAKTLGIEIGRQHFTSYPVAEKKFIIVNMYNFKNKQSLLNKIRVKRSLMVEEVFSAKSNSQIYLNDHLTPYFNRLFLIARTAKKDGKIASATSYGGKIRARKNINDAPTIITTENQLRRLIDDEDDSDNNISAQQVSMMDTSHSTTKDTSPNTINKKQSRRPKKTNNRNQYKPITAKPRPDRKRTHTDKFDANREITNKKQRTSDTVQAS